MRITSLVLALTAVARSADPSVPHIHSGAFKQYQHAKPSKYGLSAGRVPKSERMKKPGKQPCHQPPCEAISECMQTAQW